MKAPSVTAGEWEWDGDPSNYDPENEAPWLISYGADTVLRGEIHCDNPADWPMLAASKKLAEASHSAMVKLEELYKELGPCDHSVGCCFCDIRVEAEKLKSSLLLCGYTETDSPT